MKPNAYRYNVDSKKMRLECPVYYSIDGRLTGKKLSRTYAFREFVAIEISDLSTEDAPVSCVWSPGFEDRPYAERPYITDNGIADLNGNQTTRWYDGRHWKRILTGDCAGRQFRRPGPALNSELALKKLLAGDAQTALGVECMVNWTDRFVDVEQDAASRFETVKVSAREKAVQETESIPDRVIAIGGELYRSCVEPHITVSRGNRDLGIKSHIVIETEVSSITSDRYRLKGIFPISDFEKAYRLAVVEDHDEASSAELRKREPRQIMAEAFSTDWTMVDSVTQLVLQAQASARWNNVIFDELLTEALRTIDSDERHAAISKFVEYEGYNWRNGIGLPIEPLEEALRILDERRIDVSIASSMLGTRKQQP
jgi:hypothetical protein